MKTTITINNKAVEIELTAEQVAKIKKSATHFTDIKTLQDALDYNGETLEHFEKRTQFDDDKEKADKELAVIAKAIRQGNELGNNEGDYWHYPWFHAARSARGFSFHDDFYDDGHSIVGSRHCVETAEKATYMGKQFLSIYNRSING